jgi:hypothetical protein
MRSLKWNRDDAVRLLRRDLWRYVVQSSQSEEDILMHASHLLQMPSSEVRYLSQLQFVLSDAVGTLLDRMPALSRRLTTTTMKEIEVSAEKIRGPVRWGETLAVRAATGLPNAYVTAPTRRAFDTPENQILKFALHTIAEFGKRTGWHRSMTPGPAQLVRNRVTEADRWSRLRALADVTAAPPTPRGLARVRGSRSRRRYQPALDVIELFQRFIGRLDRDAIRDAIEHHALIVSRDSVLLELRCAFDTIGSLERMGWGRRKPGLVRPPLIYTGQQGQQNLELFFQHTPRQLSSGSLYRDVQKVHGFSSTGGLIPDLVLKTSSGDKVRWLLIEVKGGFVSRTVVDSARTAARDLLAYRRSFNHVLAPQNGPYGIGYAWGAELPPNPEAEILLCTPDKLDAALELALVPTA